MSDMLVEVYFDTSAYGDLYSRPNMLSREQLDVLQSVCSRPVEYKQMSKMHVKKGVIYLYGEDEESDEAKQLVDLYCIGNATNIATVNGLLGTGLNLEFKIRCKIKDVPEYSVEETILHKLLSLESKLSIFDKQTEFNTKVGVHISDLGLLNVRKVTWAENCCTEVLQNYLDDGWRILAVCPQPDSRRPDYILGRNE